MLRTKGKPSLLTKKLLAEMTRGCSTAKYAPPIKSTPSRQERSETDALRLSPPS